MNAANAVQATIVVGVLLLSMIALSGTASGAQPSITNVTVSPQEPQTGELVRFTTTIRNSEGADGSVEVENVWIREAGTTNEYARVTNPGNVPPGSTLEVPLTARFDSTGVKDLRIRVNVVDEDDELTRLEYPVTVVVSEPGNLLSIDVDEPVVGQSTAVNVTVSNGRADPLRQLDLQIGGDGVSARNPRRLLARLEAGQDRTFTFDVEFTEAGERPLEAVLQYASTSGQTQTVRQTQTVDVEELREDVSVDARVGAGGGSNPPLLVEVTNFGNARLSDVRITVTDGDRTVARRAAASVEAESSRTTAVNLSRIDEADLDVTVSYETGGRPGEATTSVRYASQPGRIELTGIDYSREGDVTTISGSASNVGLGEVNSVVLRVLPAEGVEPVSPNREYFVGTVPASDFVSFDLTARVGANVSSVPIEVSYVADGIRHTESASVPYESAGLEQPDRSSQGSGPGGIGSILLVVVLLVAAIGGVVWWRRRGDGGE